MCLSRIASAVRPSVAAMLNCVDGPPFTHARNGVQPNVHWKFGCRTSGLDFTSRTTNKNGHHKGARADLVGRRQSHSASRPAYLLGLINVVRISYRHKYRHGLPS